MCVSKVGRYVSPDERGSIVPSRHRPSAVMSHKVVNIQLALSPRRPFALVVTHPVDEDPTQGKLNSTESGKRARPDEFDNFWSNVKDLDVTMDEFLYGINETDVTPHPEVLDSFTRAGLFLTRLPQGVFYGKSVASGVGDAHKGVLVLEKMNKLNGITFLELNEGSMDWRRLRFVAENEMEQRKLIRADVVRHYWDAFQLSLKYARTKPSRTFYYPEVSDVGSSILVLMLPTIEIFSSFRKGELDVNKQEPWRVVFRQLPKFEKAESTESTARFHATLVMLNRTVFGMLGFDPSELTETLVALEDTVQLGEHAYERLLKASFGDFKRRAESSMPSFQPDDETRLTYEMCGTVGLTTRMRIRTPSLAAVLGRFGAKIGLNALQNDWYRCASEFRTGRRWLRFDTDVADVDWPWLEALMRDGPCTHDQMDAVMSKMVSALDGEFQVVPSKTVDDMVKICNDGRDAEPDDWKAVCRWSGVDVELNWPMALHDVRKALLNKLFSKRVTWMPYRHESKWVIYALRADRPDPVVDFWTFSVWGALAAQTNLIKFWSALFEDRYGKDVERYFLGQTSVGAALKNLTVGSETLCLALVRMTETIVEYVQDKKTPVKARKEKGDGNLMLTELKQILENHHDKAAFVDDVLRVYTGIVVLEDVSVSNQKHPRLDSDANVPVGSTHDVYSMDAWNPEEMDIINGDMELPVVGAPAESHTPSSAPSTPSGGTGQPVRTASPPLAIRDASRQLLSFSAVQRKIAEGDDTEKIAFDNRSEGSGTWTVADARAILERGVVSVDMMSFCTAALARQLSAMNNPRVQILPLQKFTYDATKSLIGGGALKRGDDGQIVLAPFVVGTKPCLFVRLGDGKTQYCHERVKVGDVPVNVVGPFVMGGSQGQRPISLGLPPSPSGVSRWFIFFAMMRIYVGGLDFHDDTDMQVRQMKWASEEKSFGMEMFWSSVGAMYGD